MFGDMPLGLERGLLTVEPELLLRDFTSEAPAPQRNVNVSRKNNGSAIRGVRIQNELARMRRTAPTEIQQSLDLIQSVPARLHLFLLSREADLSRRPRADLSS